MRSNGLSLEEAAKCGDFERCAHLAVELLRVARQGDADAVLDIVSSKKNGGSSRSVYDVKFSPHISVIHEFQHGIRVEQVKARKLQILMYGECIECPHSMPKILENGDCPLS